MSVSAGSIVHGHVQTTAEESAAHAARQATSAPELSRSSVVPAVPAPSVAASSPVPASPAGKPGAGGASAPAPSAVAPTPPPTPAAPPPILPVTPEKTAQKATPAPTAKPAPKPAPNPGQLAAGYPFGAQSVWRADISGAPVAADSQKMVDDLNGTVVDRYNGVAAFNAYEYNNSYYVAPAGTPTVDVSFNDCQGKGHTPDGLLGPGGQFSDVPIPAGAVPSPGTDKALSIYSPESDTLWELWVTERTADGGWSACWGGRIDSVSTSPGFFSNGFGATATGLASTGGMVRLADVRSGTISHAMSLAIPNPKVYTDLSWPAQRSDGFDNDPHAVPEGTRLRLDPSLDVDSLKLHPVAAMIAKAAQKYGFIVVDKSGSVSVIAESGAPEQAATGTDPWKSVLGDTPSYSVMAGFPWDRLQALPKDYGRR